MRYLVLGAGGMAGHVIARFLSERGHDVDTVARSAGVVVPDVVLDVTDRDRLKRLVTTGGYDVVVNCVGLLIQTCEQHPADAVLVNAHLPQHLARMLSGMHTRLIHLSTDCVFSGASGPYAEDAPFDGQRVYDRSKALGEVINDKDLTLRMSIIGPELTAGGTGLFNWFAAQEGTIKGYTKALWNGITTIELARAVEALSVCAVTGLVHLVPTESLSKFELLSMLNSRFGTKLTIEPSDGYSADKRLVDTREDLPFAVQGYERMMGDLHESITSHPSLYPHYARLLNHAGPSSGKRLP